MMNDVGSVMWKERRGLMRMQGRRSQAVMMLVMPVAFSIFFPILLKQDWFITVFPVILAGVASMLLVAITIPDSFAGERERRTLATLLSTRLPDRAILLGKMIIPIGFGWGMSVLVLLMGAVLTNLVAWTGRLTFYRADIFFGSIAIGLSLALVTAGAGVLFSMHAESVQGAQQSLMTVLLVPPMVAQLGLFFVVGAARERADLRALLAGVDVSAVIGSIVVILAVTAAALFWLALRRFQRERLILA